MSEPQSLSTEQRTITPVSPVSWVPLIGLLLMAVVTFVLLKYVVNIAPHNKFSSLIASLTWSISVLFFTLSILITFVTAFQVIGSSLRSVKLWIGVLALFIAVGIVTVVMLPPGQGFKFNEKIFSELYRLVPLTKTFVDSVQILGAVALVAIAIAVSLVLTQSRRRSVQQLEVPIRATALARDHQLIQKLLYVSALSLVAGALQSSALYSWGITLAPPELMLPDIANYDPAKSSGIPQLMGGLNGAFYSILLAVIFTPAFIQLRGAGDRLINEVKPPVIVSERDAWFASHALVNSVPQKLFSALAILSPFLAGGPLTVLFEMISR